MKRIQYCLGLTTCGAALLWPLSSRAASATVGIVDFAFSPSSVSVNVGDTVTWTNQGAITHTSTSGTSPTPDGLWTSGFLNPAMTFSHQFTSSGSFPYYCQVHTFMTASVTVQEAATNMVKLAVRMSGNNLIVSWSPAAGTLQSTTELLGAETVWTDVGTANPATVPIAAGNLFLRVKQ